MFGQQDRSSNDMVMPYNAVPVDANYKIKPRLNRSLSIVIPQDLEPEDSSLRRRSLRLGV